MLLAPLFVYDLLVLSVVILGKPKSGEDHNESLPERPSNGPKMARKPLSILWGTRNPENGTQSGAQNRERGPAADRHHWPRFASPITSVSSMCTISLIYLCNCITTVLQSSVITAQSLQQFALCTLSAHVLDGDLERYLGNLGFRGANVLLKLEL